MIELDHAERQKSLNSTDVAAILGLEGARKTEHEVWLEKTGRLEPWTGNTATHAGKYLEPSILDYAEAELGPLKRSVQCKAEGLNFPLAATLDAQVIANGLPVEAKTSGIVGPVYGEWGEADSDVVPFTYLVQTTIQMVCSGQELAYLYALLGGRGFVKYQIMRSDDVVRTILERLERWWERHVCQGIEPTITEPIPMSVLKRIRRQPATEVEIGEAGALAVAEWEAARAAKSAAEKTFETSQSILVAMLRDAEAGRLPDGRLVTYLATTRKGYTVNETTFRTLRLKK